MDKERTLGYGVDNNARAFKTVHEVLLSRSIWAQRGTVRAFWVSSCRDLKCLRLTLISLRVGDGFWLDFASLRQNVIASNFLQCSIAKRNGRSVAEPPNCSLSLTIFVQERERGRFTRARDGCPASLSDAHSQKQVRAQGAPLGIDYEPTPLYSAANLDLSKVHFRFQT